MTTAPPTREDVVAVLESVIDPELGSDIVSLGMVPAVSVSPTGEVDVTVKLTIGGCPLRADIKREIESRVGVHPGVRDVHITWGEMTPDERTDVMLKARWNARQHAGDTQVPASTRVVAIASGKGGVGKSSVTVNLAVALARQGRTVGVLDADIWGFSVPRLLGMSERMEAERVDGSDRPLILPNTMAVGDGLLKVVSTGFLVEEDTALMWRGLMLTKAVEQFLHDVHWGDLDDLLIDMPPGTGDVQMGLARLLPRADMVIVTTPALAAQKVAQRAADMARRSFVRVVGVIENMTDFTCEHGTSYPLFGAGGGEALAAEIGVPLLGQVPIEPAVSAGGDAGRPVALDDGAGAAAAFRSIAERLDAAIPVAADPEAPDMAGCSARLLAAVEVALESAGSVQRLVVGVARHGHADDGAALVATDLRLDARRRADGVGDGQRLVGRRALGDETKVGDRRRHHQQGAGLGLGDGFVGTDPHAVHQLGLVVSALLPVWRGGEEEARVEAPRALADRGHPVGDVADGREVEDEIVAPAELLHRQLPGVDGLALGVGDPRLAAVAGARQQQARLLEALPHGRHPEREAAVVDAQGRRGGGVVEAVAVRLERRRPVDVVDPATGEHVHPGGEGGVRRAAQHEDLHAGDGAGVRLGVAHDHDGGGGAGRDDPDGQWLVVRSRSGEATGGSPAGCRRNAT